MISSELNLSIWKPSTLSSGGHFIKRLFRRKTRLLELNMKYLREIHEVQLSLGFVSLADTYTMLALNIAPPTINLRIQVLFPPTFATHST